MTDSTTPAAASEIGSMGERPYSRLFINRAQANETRDTYGQSGNRDGRAFLQDQRSRFAGVAPSAARMPNSRARPLTE